MAIKMTAEEIATFKDNLEQMMPYQSKDLINILAKGLYNSSNFSYEIVTGLEASVVINNIQMYSRHNVYQECVELCAHLPLQKLAKGENLAQKVMDEVEDSLYPKRHELRAKKREKFQNLAQENETLLQNKSEPSFVDTSDFPELAKNLKISCVADDAHTKDYMKPPCVNIYGVAGGHVVEYLHSLYPQLEINVYILNPEVTAIMLCLDQVMGKRFANEHVHLHFGTDTTPILENAIFLLPEIVLMNNQYQTELKLRLTHHINKTYQALLSRKRNRQIHNILMRHSFAYCKDAPQLKTDTFGPCKKIALLLSGPSLADNFSRVQELKSQGVRLIACDSALPFLESKNCAPDLVVCNYSSIYRFASTCYCKKPLIFTKEQLYDKSVLLFSSKTHLLIPALFTGKKYVIYTPDLKMRKVAKQDNAVVDLDLSQPIVLTLASLALRQGAHSIYIFGMDCVPRLDSYHAGFNEIEDTALVSHNQKQEAVLCNDQKLRRSIPDYTEAKLQLEKLIRKHRGINFINCSPYGAIINGCSLDEPNT